jgi:hypothetical protein
MPELYNTATEYTFNELTFTRGGPTQVTAVGVYHTTDANYIPQVTDFTTVQLIDGASDPANPLAQGGVIDVVAQIGPAAGADLALAPGTYHRWVLVTTQAVGTRPGENIIRKAPDTLTVK